MRPGILSISGTKVPGVATQAIRNLSGSAHAPATRPSKSAAATAAADNNFIAGSSHVARHIPAENNPMTTNPLPTEARRLSDQQSVAESLLERPGGRWGRSPQS